MQQRLCHAAAVPLQLRRKCPAGVCLGWVLFCCWSRLGAHPLHSPSTPSQARDMAKEKAESIDARIADLSECSGALLS